MLTLALSAALAAPADATLEDLSRDPSPPLADPAFDAPSTRIINGEDATREDWSMSGGVVMTANLRAQGQNFPQTALICSSTLIAPDVVLLAAHCVDPAPLQLQLQFQGIPGLTIEDIGFQWSRRANLSQYQLGAPPEDLPEDAVPAVDWVMHPDWNFLGLELGLAENDDIALLFLETPVLDVPLAYLPQADTDEVELAVDDEVVVVGWGQQTSTAQGQVPPAGTVGFKQMGTSHVEEVARFEFQVGAVRADVRKCHGDSGGPTFKQVETDSSETWRQIGVTSHSYDLSDCSETGGVDTRLSHYLEWIDAEMRAACEDGIRTWCEIEGIIPPPYPDGTPAWEDPPEEEKKGCGCAAAPPYPAWALVLPLLALARRGRRGEHRRSRGGSTD